MRLAEVACRFRVMIHSDGTVKLPVKWEGEWIAAFAWYPESKYPTVRKD